MKVVLKRYKARRGPAYRTLEGAYGCVPLVPQELAALL